jgi:hypothetical protein
MAKIDTKKAKYSSVEQDPFVLLDDYSVSGLWVEDLMSDLKSYILKPQTRIKKTAKIDMKGPEVATKVS